MVSGWWSWPSWLTLHWVAAAQAQPSRAGRLLGAAEALPEALGVPLAPDRHTSHTEAVAASCTALGAEGFAAASAAGRVLPLEAAISLAIERDPGH
jgi:hypothetical protein